MVPAMIEADFEFKELESIDNIKTNAMNEMWEKHVIERNSKRSRNSPENGKNLERDTRLRREVTGSTNPSM